jgi:hypothetical protein
METPEQKFEKLRTTCWNNAITSFGIAYIFDKSPACLPRLNHLDKDSLN